MKHVLITGGTGSFGRAFTERLLRDKDIERIVIFSRDEAKHHAMKQAFSDDRLEYIIGDIRNETAVMNAMRRIDTVVHAAAMKQVPTGQRQPAEVLYTNIEGSENIVNAAIFSNSVRTVVGLSTDKACDPLNLYGMSKRFMEHLFIEAAFYTSTKFCCVRYGNVMASTGSVIPLFKKQIADGGPITITDKRMTRFWMTLDNAVDTVLHAINNARTGEVVVPPVRSSTLVQLAECMIRLSHGGSYLDNAAIDITEIGIRPGEKLHEQLVSSEEATRTVHLDYYYIQPEKLWNFPRRKQPTMSLPVSSADCIMSDDELRWMLESLEDKNERIIE